MDATTISNLEPHLTIHSKPNLKENNVSRRAVKPIYTKDQVYDGQTQCTEQTLVSSASIRAGNTASALGDSNFNMHLPISSKSYNAYKSLSINTSTQNITNTCYNLFFQQHNLPLLKENEILGSFLKHLFNYSFLQLILISINQTFTEAHIYLNLKEPILKNHQILESNQFLTFCHLPI